MPPVWNEDLYFFTTTTQLCSPLQSTWMMPVCVFFILNLCQSPSENLFFLCLRCTPSTYPFVNSPAPSTLWIFVLFLSFSPIVVPNRVQGPSKLLWLLRWWVTSLDFRKCILQIYCVLCTWCLSENILEQYMWPVLPKRVRMSTGWRQNKWKYWFVA